MENSAFQRDFLQSAIKLALLFFLLYSSLRIIEPFMVVVLWAAIIATALFPLHKKLTPKLGNKQKYSAIILTLSLLLVLIAPVYLLAESLYLTTQVLAERFADGSFEIPGPPDKVSELPLIGNQIAQLWNNLSTDANSLFEKNQEMVATLSSNLFSAAALTAKTVLIFIVSILISGVLLHHADAASRVLYKFSKRLMGERGEGLVNTTAAIIQSVIKGVLGTATIQALMATIGMALLGVPGIGLWALLVLLLGVMQLPPILILGPVAVYVYSVEPGWIATLFLIYCLIISGSDAVLKPLLLGRGVELPTLVILIGAIGGMLTSGIIGLFTGAVVLALTYQLFIAWLDEAELPEDSSHSEKGEPT